MEPLNNKEDQDAQINAQPETPQTYQASYFQMGFTTPPSAEIFVERIGMILQQIVVSNEEKVCAETGFTAERVPGISVEAYLKRISHYCIASPESYIYCLIYMDRFNECRGDCYLNKWNVHKMAITGMLVASKFNDDFRLSNEDYAKIGGITNIEINVLELLFLETIGFNLHVEKPMFKEYLMSIFSFEDEDQNSPTSEEEELSDANNAG